MKFKHFNMHIFFSRVFCALSSRSTAGENTYTFSSLIVGVIGGNVGIAKNVAETCLKPGVSCRGE
jgi:hypothetical protein